MSELAEGLAAVEAQRLVLGPDDALVLRWTDRDQIGMDEADEIKGRVRALLGRPHLPVLCVGRSVEVLCVGLPDAVGVATLPHHQEE